ncbi:hypothetical protein FRC11_004849, partial [Ceratobasidium sp. 423]
MPPQTHPRWGRPISLYTESYGLDEANIRLNWIGDIELPARAAIERIGRVRPNQISHGVTLSDLKSILTFSRAAVSYPCYASRPLIRGCIYLMNTIKLSGKISVGIPKALALTQVAQSIQPFNYEYGYLCFRIMTIALGTCLLNNSVGVEFATADMIHNSTSPLMPLLDFHVAQIMESAIRHTEGEGRDMYNCILGWSRCEDHPDKDVIVSVADVGTLFRLLWEDRALFLKAMTDTISPGLSAVIYLIWRYVIYGRYLQGTDFNFEKSLNRFVGIFWRAFFTTSTNQVQCFHMIAAWTYGEYKWWDNIPERVQLEDTKQIIETFAIHMLQPNSPMPPTDIPYALSFIHQHSLEAPGCEEKLPFLILGV